MGTINAAQFYAIAKAQGVTFTPEFRSAFFNEARTGDVMHAKTALGRPIMRAGRLLMRREALVESSQELTGLPEWRDDPTASTLQSLINESQIPERDRDNRGGFKSTTETLTVGRREDDYFAVARKRLDEFNSGASISPGIGVRLFVDSDRGRRPIFMQKKGKLPPGIIDSAVSISQFKINGMLYPKGSIVRLNLARPYDDSHEVTLLDVDEISGVGFLRLAQFSPGFTGQGVPALEKMIGSAAKTVRIAPYDQSTRP